jgi:protoheme IX farnesyltransferase
LWAQSKYVRSEYGGEEVPLLPVVAGYAATRRQILVYSLIMAAAAVAPWPLGLTGWIFGGTAAALGILFVGFAIAVARNDATEPKLMGPEKRLFAISILYLFVLFASLVADRWLLA